MTTWQIIECKLIEWYNIFAFLSDTRDKFSTEISFTWIKHLRHGVSLCSYHRLIRENFDPIWFKLPQSITSRKRPLRLDNWGVAVGAVRLYYNSTTLLLLTNGLHVLQIRSLQSQVFFLQVICCILEDYDVNRKRTDLSTIIIPSRLPPSITYLIGISHWQSCYHFASVVLALCPCTKHL